MMLDSLWLSVPWRARALGEQDDLLVRAMAVRTLADEEAHDGVAGPRNWGEHAPHPHNGKITCGCSARR